jgi:hypothetical protein
MICYKDFDLSEGIHLMKKKAAVPLETGSFWHWQPSTTSIIRISSRG